MGLLRDVRYAVRALLKASGFSGLAVLTLALGIGASTAVFSLVNAVLLKPLPYGQPDRIVFPWRQMPPGLALGYNEIPWGLRDLQGMRELQTFEYVSAFQSDYFNLTGTGEPARLDGTKVSSEFFAALGVAPALGRVFTAGEDRPGHEHVAILSDRLWRERFGADPQIVGRSIELGAASYLVAGVMPRGFAFPHAEEMPHGFQFPRTPQLWVPLALPPEPLHPWDPDELAVVARLRPGVTLQQAQAEMDVFSRRKETLVPRAKGWYNSRVTPLTRQAAGDTRRPLLLILGAVGIVLLIACSNVASLVLARSIPRRREFTLRAALGAGRARLVRQVLTENLLLAASGGAAGLLLAQWAIRFVQRFGPADIPRLGDAALDARVGIFALGLVLLTGILFGLAPALGAARGNLADALKEAGRGSAGSGLAARMRQMLLVTQVAMALVLVIAAGLLARTFVHLLQADPGFRAERVLTFELSLPPGRYAESEAPRLYAAVLRQLRQVSGVVAAGIAKTIPLGGAPDSTAIRIAGHPPIAGQPPRIAAYNLASPGYFAAVGTPILRGRELVDGDLAPGARPVVVINRAMAEKFWPGEDALGNEVGPGSPAFPLMTIVGVAADAKDLSLRQQPGPEMYVPFHLKTYVSLLTVQAAVRTRAEPSEMARAITAAVRAVDPDLPLAKLAAMTTLLDESTAPARFSAWLLGGFGALAMVLAAVGMYGVISYAVAQRTREIGLRMALGAHAGDVFGMVLGQGARLALAGVAAGIAGALAAGRIMESFLYGVAAADPLTFAAVSALLIGVVLAACYVPARRAMRVDPVVALRNE